MSSFARAAARAAGAAQSSALAPAITTTSPLAQADQRLHLPAFVDALGKGAVGLGPATERGGPADLAPSFDIAVTPFVAAEPFAEPRPARTIAEPPIEATSRTIESTSASPRPAEPRIATLSSALSAVDRWMRQPPARPLAEGPSENVRPRALEPSARVSVPTPFESLEPRLSTRASASTTSSERARPSVPAPSLAPRADVPALASRLAAVERRLPTAAQSTGAPPFTVVTAPVSAPLLKIGRIDVRVVQAPERRSAQRTQRRAAAPRPTALASRAPFGWRQR